MIGPTREFWEERFATGNMPWDRGASSPQLASCLRSGLLKPCGILVPGCGSGYEVVDLALAGFEVTGLDYADEAIARTHRNLKKARVDATLVQADVLAWEPDRAFDAVYEQTCLGALYPDQGRASGGRWRRRAASGARLTPATSPPCGRCFRSRAGRGGSRLIRGRRIRRGWRSW